MELVPGLALELALSGPAVDPWGPGLRLDCFEPVGHPERQYSLLLLLAGFDQHPPAAHFLYCERFLLVLPVSG